MVSSTRATKQGFRAPFLIVNPKAYLYGKELLDLAHTCDALAAEYDIDVIFTAQHVDLRMVAEATQHLTVCAQHVDGIKPGRGMGHILPEGLVEAGAKGVVLNHAEHSLDLPALDAAITRAKEVGLMTIVCADTDAQCRAVATMNPDIMICEPTAKIGTGDAVSGEYVERTVAVVREVNPEILIIEAAGVANGDDVARVLSQGADGSGGTSSICNAPDRGAMVRSMLDAIAAHRQRNA